MKLTQAQKVNLMTAAMRAVIPVKMQRGSRIDQTLPDVKHAYDWSVRELEGTNDVHRKK